MATFGTMVLFSKLPWLCLLVSSTRATWVDSLLLSQYGINRITFDTTFDAEDHDEEFLMVSKDVKCEFENSQYVHYDDYLCNYGQIFLKTDASALESHRHFVFYDIHGFYNEGLLVVHHQNKDLPINVLFGGVRRPFIFKFGLWTSENLGRIILLSNGPKLDGEFALKLETNFINLGSISVLGTRRQAAQMCLIEKKEGAILTNNGIIYVKHAAFSQTADFAGAGCIAVGHKGEIHLNSDRKFGGQRLHIVDGTGVIFVAAGKETNDQRYYVTNFPKGATIQFENPISNWKVEGSYFTVSNPVGSERVTISFEGYTLDERKIRIDEGKMGYAADLTSGSPAVWCSKIDLVIEEVRTYEIRE